MGSRLRKFIPVILNFIPITMRSFDWCFTFWLSRWCHWPTQCLIFIKFWCFYFRNADIYRLRQSYRLHNLSPTCRRIRSRIYPHSSCLCTRICWTSIQSLVWCCRKMVLNSNITLMLRQKRTFFQPLKDTCFLMLELQIFHLLDIYSRNISKWLLRNKEMMLRNNKVT